MAVCWMNGSMIPAEEARVSVFDHGLLYGDGVFEGVRFYHGRPFRLREHLQRLCDSARAIALSMPYSEDEWRQAVMRTIEALGEPEGYLRVVLTRGVGTLGIDPFSCVSANAFIIADRLKMFDRQGIRVVIASSRRAEVDVLDARIKSLNYLPQVLARLEASRAGADEALLLNARGFLAEGAASNVFLVRDGVLLTPMLTDGALAGVTRAWVLEQARALGMMTRECGLTPYDLHTAEECFLTGSGAELVPVSEVNGRALPSSPGPFFLELRSAFRRAILQECGDG